MIHRFSDSEQDAVEARSHRTLVGTLFHRRVTILIGLGLLLIAAITLVVVLPRQFQSQFDILVRNKLPLSARVKATGQETVDEQRMKSELALIHSSDLAARVVNPDYPTQPDATHTAADIKRHQAAVTRFSQQLTTTIAPNSNLIHVVVTAEDPHRAGELASRLLEVFFASQAEVGHPTPATSFFIAEANRARAAWQEAQLSLDGFRLVHLTAPTGNAADITLQIAALNHQIQRNDEQIDAAIGRILTGERRLITIPAHPLDPGRTSRTIRPTSSSMPELSVVQLNAMLAIYNDEQAILLTRPPTDMEAVRASLSLAGQIADTTAAKHFAEQTASTGHDPTLNILWQSTTDEIAQASSELKTLYLTRTGLANQLSGFQDSLDRIERPSTILAGFQTKTTTLQDAFRIADQRANEACIADAMDQQLRLNVAVASRPSFSNTATSPSPWLYGAAIALAVVFLAACLTLFAGMSSNEAEIHELDDYEDLSEACDAQGYVPDPSEAGQQRIPFTSRIPSSQSGAFLYAAPGASVPPPWPTPEAAGLDPAFETTPQSFVAVEPQTAEADPQILVEEGQAETAAPESESHPSPLAEILHPHQYSSGETLSEEPAESPSGFESLPPFARQASGETHAAVPSFFAAPPSASQTTEPEEEHDLAHEEGPPYPFFHDHPLPDPNSSPAFPCVTEPAASTPAPPAEEPASVFPAPESEPIVSTPDPTPPWSQPAVEPKPAPVPPLSYWALADDAAPAVAEPTEPRSVTPQPAVTPAPALQLAELPPAPDQTSIAPEPAALAPEPAAASKAMAAPLLLQAFTSTVRPAPFLTTVTSTLSAPAFQYVAPAPRVAPPPVQEAAETPTPAQPAPELAALAPDPKLILSYASSSEPIELVPDPILPQVKLPYKIVPPQSAETAPAPEPTRVPPPEFSEFPLYRTPKPLPARETPTTHESGRSQTYEDMVHALVFPEESAPYVPPARPAPTSAPVAAAPRRAESLPELLPNAPPAIDPLDDEAPPFYYTRRSTPTPQSISEPALARTPELEDYDALPTFVRRSSTPLEPPSPRTPYPDDRTTYRAAQPPGPPQPASPQPVEIPRSSWIDITPPPSPRGEELDPQKRPPDRISAIRDQSSVRSSLHANLVDESGNRLTPSQRMKRGRPAPTYDKDGKVSYVDYRNDQDKTRY